MPLTQRLPTHRRAVQRSSIPQAEVKPASTTKSTESVEPELPGHTTGVERIQRSAEVNEPHPLPTTPEQPDSGNGADLDRGEGRSLAPAALLARSTPREANSKPATRHAPNLQRTISANTAGANLPVVLPQVREAAGAETAPQVGEHQRVSRAEFGVQRRNTPQMSRNVESNSVRMPLLQRKAVLQSNEMNPPDIDVEIKRLAEPSTKTAMVMRKPLPVKTAAKEDSSEIQRKVEGHDKDTSPSAVEKPKVVTRTKIVNPDIDELATAVLPLIRRMMMVERERSRSQ
ncbi:MAG TPA: hypothetical protein VGK87_15820 [Anaerolineae bacterium]|jgi:hypothetical protein